MTSPETPTSRYVLSGRQPRAGKARWAPVLLCALSFLTGLALVDRAAPPDQRGNIGVARRLFLEQADELDVVFLGSSRFQRGIDVEAIEGEFRAAGRDWRAFNYGVPGLRTLEQGHVLRQILERRPRHLKWVVLEAGAVGITVRKNSDYSRKAEGVSARTISWHTTQVTRRALAAIQRFPLPWDERVELAGDHLDLWARRATNLGLLSERYLESASARAQREWQEGKALLTVAPETAASEQEPGFGAVLGVVQRDRGRANAPGRRGERGAAEYKKLAGRVAEQNELPVELDQLDLEIIAERVREARAAGVELVFVTIPTETGSPEVLRLHAAGLLEPLLHFNDPVRYPEFYKKVNRRDFGHLNPVGAEAFSRLLAREFVALQAGGEGVE